MSKILVIGDPHIRKEYLHIAELLHKNIVDILKQRGSEYSFVVILGDVLHDHGKISTNAMNIAIDLIKTISESHKLFILVGNHDMINDSQFLTKNHWMNCLKTMNNVTIVDEVISYERKKKKYVMCPFVPTGRFIEALNTLNEKEGINENSCKWQNADTVFGHQEIRCAKMNGDGFPSTKGDVWNSNYPTLISGHIHHKQKLDNVIYPGSSVPTSFSDSEQKYVLEFNPRDGSENYIALNIPVKITNTISVEEFDELEEFDKNVRIIVEGSQIELEKRLKQFKKLKTDGLNISERIIKDKKLDDDRDGKRENREKRNPIDRKNLFIDNLHAIIDHEENSEELYKIYNKFVL